MSHLPYDFSFPFLHSRFFHLRLLHCHLFGGNFYNFAHLCDYLCFSHFCLFCHISTGSFEDSSVSEPVFFYFYCKLMNYLLLLACCLVLLFFGDCCCVECAGRVECVERIILYILIFLYNNDFFMPICCSNWR